MTPNLRALCAVVALGGAAPTLPAQDAPRPAVNVEEPAGLVRALGRAQTVFRWRHRYFSLDPADRDAFDLVYALEGPGADNAVLWFDDGDQMVVLSRTGQGRIRPPDADTLSRRNPVIWAAPADRPLDVRVGFAPKLPPERTLDVDPLKRALAQAERALRSKFGLIGHALPPPRRVRAIFEGPAPQAWALGPDNQKVALPARFDTVDYEPLAIDFRTAQRLTFDRAPLRLELLP
ncbi:MAG: hypothetical protein ACFB2Z_09515 [Maricaulaceae bacterium]